MRYLICNLNISRIPRVGITEAKMRKLIAVAFLAFAACGPDLAPAPGAQCEQVCVSVTPSGREPPHCAPLADGGQVCPCTQWETICE